MLYQGSRHRGTIAYMPRRIWRDFCPACGCAPCAFGTDEAGNEVAAVNGRCLEGIEPVSLESTPFDGCSL